MSKPNFFERAIAAVNPRYALERAVMRDRLVQFGYDAATPEGKRGQSGGMGKNASSETPKMAKDRLATMWDARDLERNMPIIRCSLDRVSQYVCGQILYQAATDDPEADSEYEAYMKHWFENIADVTGRFNFRMLIELGFRSMLRDGDFGFQMVRTGQGLQLRCIESDRIGDPNMVATQSEEDYIQGIKIDPNGRPIYYDIYKRNRKTLRYDKDVEVPARNFYHLHKPLRTDEYRGVSWLAPVLAPARDLYEMFAFERGAAKWAAHIAGVIRITDPLARNLQAASAGVFDGITTTGDPKQTIEGNKLLRLKPNEDVTTFDTGRRPSGAFQAYIENSIRDIAMGLNVPYGFFNMASFGGATVRLEAQQLDRTFGRYQEILETQAMDGIVNEVLNDAIARRLIRPTRNWRGRRWQFGPRLTADTGHDTDANLQLLGYGLKSASAIAGEQGLDYEELVTQTVKEVVMIRDAATAAGLPMEMVAAIRFPGATDQMAAIQSALQPQTNPTAMELGDGGVKNIAALLEMAANGTLPREKVVATLVTVFEFLPEIAEAIVPTVQKIAVDANKPAPVAGPGGAKKSEASKGAKEKTGPEPKSE